MRSARARIALVNMPFAMVDRPSIQCGLLKALLEAHGHRTSVVNLNMELAAAMGAHFYQELSFTRSVHLLGDWLFSEAAFGGDGREEEYLRACPEVEGCCRDLGLDFEDLCALRATALPAQITLWARRYDWSCFDVVGFTSTFEQQVSSLALARSIKALHPGVVVMFGGANVDGEMGPEHHRAFPWLDYVVSGEAELVLPDLVERILTGTTAEGLPGVAGRELGRLFTGGRAPAVHDLDLVPDPNYDEYFETLDRLGKEHVLGDAPIQLPYQGARGCWWGRRHACRFCGLNVQRDSYQVRSPARVVAGITHLTSRYSVRDIESVDTILDPEHVSGVFGSVALTALELRIFTNIPATLGRVELDLLRRAGVYSVQPGVESLNSRLLRLMGKGTSLLSNLRVLKWAHHAGMNVEWNLLTDVPGERIEDYRAMFSLVPLLWHLPPPGRCGSIWLERFSPYFQEALANGQQIRPRRAYRYVYPEQVDIERIAYFWEWEGQDILPADDLSDFREAIRAWQAAWREPVRPTLEYQRQGGCIEVIDRRRPGEERRTLLSGLVSEVLFACSETYRSKTKVANLLAEGSKAIDVTLVESALADLCEEGFMVEDGGRYYALPLPGG